MEQVVVAGTWVLSVIFALFVGGFLKSYLGKKGENLATHEDIEKLVEQVRAVTQATQEIEAAISTKAWAREIRKEALFEALKNLSKLDAALTTFLATHVTIEGQFRIDAEHRKEAENEFHTAYTGLAEAGMLVAVACGSDVNRAFKGFRETCLNLVSASLQGRFPEALEQMQLAVQQVEAIAELVRTDLGIEP